MMTATRSIQDTETIKLTAETISEAEEKCSCFQGEDQEASCSVGEDVEAPTWKEVLDGENTESVKDIVSEPSIIPSPSNEEYLPSIVDINNGTLAESTFAAADSDGTNEHDDADPDDMFSLEAEADISFEARCRFIVQIGVAAYRYGSVGAKVETFLESAAVRMGFEGIFRLSQSELMASIKETPDAWPVHYFIKIEDGVHLEKLSMVVEVAKRFLDRELGLGQAIEELEKIHEAPDPYSVWSNLLSFMGVGGGLVMVLGGSWWDVIVGTVLGGLNFVILTLFGAWLPAHMQKWSNTFCTFCVSMIATLVKVWRVPYLNVTMITLSAVAVQLPGYGISLGVSELAGNRIIAGMAHFIQGIVTLLSLALGAWLGVDFVERVVQRAEPIDMDSVPVDMIWQLLFIPILFVTLGVAFQIAYRDFPWMIMNLTITYGVSFLMNRVASKELGTFLSAVAFSIVANIWGRLKDRPNTIILLPSIVLSVSGSIGFQGVINLFNGDTFVGANQFLQMFIVAVMTFGGILVGSSVFPPQTTL